MKMKRIISCSLLLPVIALITLTLQVQADSKSNSSSDPMVTVLNPAITTRYADRIPLAPRLDSLDGKTIFLVDTNWEGMGQNSAVLEEMQAWFAEHMPGVKTVIKVKRGFYAQEDKASWQEIEDAGGDGVIIGVAG